MDVPRPPVLAWLREALGALGVPEGCTVYLRGSRLEETLPHARADLDLVVVADEVEEKRRSWEVLRPWALAQPIQVDLMGHLRAEIVARPEFRLLLATRARRVLGPPRTWTPVPADDATMRAHARAYAVSMIRTPLSGGSRMRVCALKQLTRAFGVWAFTTGRPFSRDVATCILYAEVLAPGVGAALRDAWTRVDDDPNIEVGEVRLALREGCRFFDAAP